MPYTYLLRCIPTGQVYYGVRYKIGCSPDDLWQTYFTSSKHVKQLIDQYGKDAFVSEIRRTFDTAKDARQWEHRVLRRMNVVNRDDFINKTDNISIQHNQAGKTWDEYYGPERAALIKEKLTVKRTGRKHSDETKAKIGAAGKGHRRTSGKPRNRSSYRIDGVHYANLESIAAAHGLKMTTVHYRVHSTSPQYAGWVKEK